MWRLPAVLEVRGDGPVGELGGEVGLPVVLHPLGDEIVEGALESGERHNVDLLGLHFGDVAQRPEHLLRLVVRSVPACEDALRDCCDR